MRKTVLLYNPASGRRQARRDSDVEAAAEVLRVAGVDVSISQTLNAGRTATQVSQQIADGCDAIIACGGDGTIHDVLQGIVGTNTALGIIPLGTANSLAKDLRIPSSPRAAAQALLRATPRQIAAGLISCRGLSGEPVSRYFTITAGIGADAEVFANLSAAHKRRFGHAAYYLQAGKLLLTHPFQRFKVCFKQTGASYSEQAEVGQLLAVRIANFGGLLKELAPGASLDRSDLRLVLFRTRSRWAVFAYALRGALGATWSVPDVDLSFAGKLTCEPLSANSPPIFVEADGEPLGMLPAEISLVPNALTLLMP